MSKAASTNANFQTRSASFSTHGSRNGVNLLGWDIGSVEHMTPEQERDALKARLKQLAELPKFERKKYGQEISDLCMRMHKLRAKVRVPGIGTFVMDVMRARLSKAEFNAIFNEAKLLYAAASNAQQAAEFSEVAL